MPGTRHPAGRCQAPAATSTQLLQGEFGLRALFILIFLALSWLPFTPGGSWKLHVQGPSPERPWEASTEPAPAPTHPCPIPARCGAAGRAVNGALRACSCIGLPSPNPSPVSPRGEGEAAGRCLAATPCSESTRRARAAACSRLLQPSWVLLARGRGGDTQPGCSHRADAQGSAPTCGTRRCFSAGTRRELRGHRSGRRPAAPCGPRLGVLVTWLSRFVWRHRNLLDFGDFWTVGARG